MIGRNYATTSVMYYAAAPREKAEMNRRRAVIAERKADLRSDIANRKYDSDGQYEWRHRHFDED
jgi:hypothetical protein